jgi:acetylornithine deacetylase/succinyl-diaminopimelate desuccinylase-like protein
MTSYRELQVNGDRLNNTLQTTCSSWGALAGSATGMRRLALSQEDKEVRDWLVEQCTALGCDMKVDQMGNIFATRPGTSKDKKPIGMGSHLDTQPAGEHSIKASIMQS